VQADAFISNELQVLLHGMHGKQNYQPHFLEFAALFASICVFDHLEFILPSGA